MTRPGACWSCVAVTGILLAFALALALTGPVRTLEFGIRLPALVLAFGVIWAASRRRWGARGGGPPVPMATPCLVMSSMLGTAAVTAKLASVSPVLAAGVLLTAAVCCGMAALVLIAGGQRRRYRHRRSAARPLQRARPLAGGVPGQAVRPVGVDA